MTSGGRQAQSLSNRTNPGEWMMAEACQTSRVNIVKQRGAMLRFVLHIRSSQLDLVELILHRFLDIGLFPIDRYEFCDDWVKRELLGIEKFDHIPLLDLAHRDRKSQTNTIE
jgi:hypothetical protein